MSHQKYSIEEILNDAKKLREQNEKNNFVKPTATKEKIDNEVPPQTSVTVSVNNANGETKKTIVKIINKGYEQPVSIKKPPEAQSDTKKDTSPGSMHFSMHPHEVSDVKPETILSDSLFEDIRKKLSDYTSALDATEPSSLEQKEHTFATPDANADTITLTIDLNELKKLTPTKPKNPLQAHRDQMEKTISIDKLKLREETVKGIKDATTLSTHFSEQATESFPAIASPKDFSYTTPKNAREIAKQRNDKEAAQQQNPGGNVSRKRFIKDSVIRKNEKTAEILFSKEPPETIERPAIMRGKMRFEKTGDLDSIPEIMSVEDFQASDLAQQKNSQKTVTKPVATYAVQTKLDGFDDQLGDVPKIHEEDAESELFYRRQERIGKFRLSDKHKESEDYTDYFEYSEETDIDMKPLDDYNSPRDKEAILNHLSSKAKKLSIRSIATGILTLVMISVSILKAIGSLPDALNDTYAFMIFMSVAGVLSILFNIGTVFNGIASVFRGNMDADFPLVIATFFVVAHSAFAFISEGFLSSGYEIFMLSLSFGFLCNIFGKQAIIKRIRSSFDFLVSDVDKFTVSSIDDQKDIAIMCNGLLMGEPIVKRSVRTAFPTDFLKIAYKDEPSDKLCKRLAPFTILISLVIGIVSYFVGKDLFTAITATASASCLGIPVCSLLISNLKLIDVSKRMKTHCAMINGYAGAEKTAESNAIVLEASSLFPAGSCNFHGVKTFGGTRIDDAILQTASVVVSTQSPLKDVFSKVVVGKHSILPDVDTIVYEERMGTSAWIYGKKVLVGNRQLMLQHGIHMPGEEFESKYKHDNRYLLYLAVAGKLAAMFVVSYNADNAIRKQLNQLEKSGMTVLVHTTDSNIDEEMICQQYDLVDGFVRVLNTSSGRVFEKYASDKVDQSPSYIVHNGTAEAFISSMHYSDVLNNSKNILSILQVFGIAISLILISVFAIYGGLAQVTPLAIILFQAFWSLFVLIISKLKK